MYNRQSVDNLVAVFFGGIGQALGRALSLLIYMEMQSGVNEYWIVNPLLNTVQIYTLNQEGGNYLQKDIVKHTRTITSEILNGFDVEKLFL